MYLYVYICMYNYIYIYIYVCVRLYMGIIIRDNSRDRTGIGYEADQCRLVRIPSCRRVCQGCQGWKRYTLWLCQNSY